MEESINNVELSYKDHNEYFNHYYKLREEVNENLAEFLLDIKISKILLKNLLRLINWVNIHINSIDKLRDEYYELVDIYREGLNTQDNKKRFYKKAHEIWDELSDDNKLFELLPKPVITKEEGEIDKFWKEEENPMLMEAKKSFIDMLKNYM